MDRHWGDRGRGAYVFRSLLQRGTTLVFGSDAPVATPDPRNGVFAALERRVDGAPGGAWYREEAIGLEDALHAYTVAPARAAGVACRGTLEPGMDADLIAWRMPPEVELGSGAAFRAGEAVLTVVGGDVVMRR